jgi:hypothetical protein
MWARHVAPMGYMKELHEKFYATNPKERGHLGDLGVEV